MKVFTADVGGTWAELKNDRVLRLPRDAQLTTRFYNNLEITNEGPASVEIRFSQELLITDEAEETTTHLRSTVLAPKQVLAGRYVVERPLSEWAAIDRERSNGQPGDVHNFEILYIGPQDADLIERLVVTTGGSPLQPVPDEDGGWVVRPALVWEMNPVVQPSVRTYYRSRTKNELFFPDGGNS